MLGIALVVLLGFFLYHYRPKKLMRESRFKQILRWSELGKLLFISQCTLIVGIMFVPLIHMALQEGLLQYWMEHHNILLYPYSYFGPNDVMFLTVFYFLFLFFGWLTHGKLARPLSEEIIPSRKWFHSIFLMELLCVVFIETFMIAMICIQPSKSGYARLLSSILRGSLFLSFCPFIGVLAVGIAEHKLKTQLTF